MRNGREKKLLKKDKEKELNRGVKKMKIKNRFGVFIIIWIVVCLYDNAAAYDDKDTHRRITGKAVEYSTLNNYLIQNLGFKDGIESNIPSNTKNTIRFWLQEGSNLKTPPCAVPPIIFIIPCFHGIDPT